MESYPHVEPNGNKYRVRLKLGMHQLTEGRIANAVEAARQADLLKAWLRAVLPDKVAESHEWTLCQTSTPRSVQDDAYRALMATPVREGTWQEQIKTAPGWIASFIARVMSCPME